MSSRLESNGISREEAAAEVLALWEKSQISLRQALKMFAEELKITDWQIRTAIHSLVFETIRRLNTIDYTLNRLLKKTQVKDLDPLIRNVLRVATYLILFGKAIAPLVTNEAVSIVKRRRNKRIAGFCNAVLRKIQHTSLEDILTKTSEPVKKELRYSVPYWLLEYTERLLGPEEAHKYLLAGLNSPSVYVRVNTLRSSIHNVIRDLEKDEYQCTTHPIIPEILRLQHGVKPVTQTDPYIQNAIYLQSLASALVSRVLDPKPASIVVDLCAAPGGKTSHIAQLMENHGNIIAVDNIPVRLQELDRNLKRLGVRNTHIILANSFEPPFREGFFADNVLVDPPCSNTGVIQTRPEVKWIVNPDFIKRIRRVQSMILKRGSQLVAPDGVVVYSTCSITLDENEHLIREFLSKNSEFELVNTEPRLGSEALDDLIQCQRLYPHKDNTEGFFIAKLHRKLTATE